MAYSTQRGVIFLVFFEAAGDEWWVLCQTDLECYLTHKLPQRQTSNWAPVFL